MNRIPKLGNFNPRNWRDTINRLIEKVNRQEPRPSPGTLQTVTHQGVTTRASSAKVRAQRAEVADDRPARWQ